MLSQTDNELITRVGPQTPGGALLRRYWFPVLQSRALEAGGAPVPVRLLGEDFVAFRSPDGTVGMMERLCPHRRASMAIARNEDCGLRCLFHGWVMGHDGRVVEVPSEPGDTAAFARKVRTRRVAVRENNGLVWAHVGGGDEPQFPAFEFTAVPSENVLIAEVPGRCNWVQLAEGQIDSAHISHLHASTTGALRSLALADRAPRFDVETTPWGMHVAATRELDERRRYTRVTEFVMPSWEFIPRATAPDTAEYDDMPRFVVHQTPVDDVTTTVWYIMWHPHRPVLRSEPGGRWAVWNDEYQAVMNAPMMGQDRAAMHAGHMSGLNNLLTEDMLVAETMGPIADRSREYLGSSDTAVARFRRLLIEAIRDEAAGNVPRGCSGSVPYGRVAGIGVFHDAGVDWRERVTDLVG